MGVNCADFGINCPKTVNNKQKIGKDKNITKILKLVTRYRCRKGNFYMKNTTHRVVILKNINSDLISQAILILKNPDAVSEPAVLAEAERVVEKYMNSGVIREEKSGRLMISLIGGAIVILSCLWVFALVKMLR